MGASKTFFFESQTATLIQHCGNPPRCFHIVVGSTWVEYGLTKNETIIPHGCIIDL